MGCQKAPGMHSGMGLQSFQDGSLVRGQGTHEPMMPQKSLGHSSFASACMRSHALNGWGTTSR